MSLRCCRIKNKAQAVCCVGLWPACLSVLMAPETRLGTVPFFTLTSTKKWICSTKPNGSSVPRKFRDFSRRRIICWTLPLDKSHADKSYSAALFRRSVVNGSAWPIVSKKKKWKKM